MFTTQPTVELLHCTPLDFIQSGIRMCWNSESKSDDMGPKDLALIDRIANKNKHSSVLRHSVYIFRITASTKTLLAFSRHKAGVDFSVQSTRYTTSKRATNLTFTQTPNPSINQSLEQIMLLVQGHIQAGHSDDLIAMLLPQSYNYTFQVTMNLQAIQHFCNLRTTSHAHYDIQAVASLIFDSLPEQHQYLVTDYIHTESQSTDNLSIKD